MPTDGSGVYTLPAGYLAVTGNTIVINQHNPIFEDIRDALSARIMASGVRPMTGPLKLADGSVGAPALALASNPTWGWYKTSTGWGLSISGTLVAEFKPAVLELAGNLSVAGNANVTKTLTLKDGGDTASANALTLGDGNVFNITGTTAITSIATKGIGTPVWLRFNGILTLTHHATDLILTGSANITTAVGDWALFEEYAVGDWRMVAFSRASGAALQTSLPRGYIDGCALANNGSDATNDIDVAVGVCRDSTNAVDMNVAAMTKRLDANWAPSHTSGMRNSAVAIADTTYHIYAVAKADGTQDIYAHTSTTVATVITALQAESGGTNYLYARRIGSIVRESGAIVAFTQTGDYFERVTAKNDVAATNPGTSAVTRTLSVPLGLALFVDVFFSANQTSSAQASYGLLSALSSTDSVPSITMSQMNFSLPAGSSASPGVVPCRVLTNTSGQIRSRISTSDASTTENITTRAWLDLRGKA